MRAHFQQMSLGLAGIPVNPGVSRLPLPCDGISVDTDGAFVAFEPVDLEWLVTSSPTMLSAGVWTYLVNGNFATDTIWTKGANWTIPGGNVAHHAAVAADTIYQASVLPVNARACIRYTNTRDAGTSITAGIGTGVGTAVGPLTDYCEIILGITNGNVVFTPTADWHGTISNVYVYPVTDPMSNKSVYPIRCKRILCVSPAAAVVRAHYYNYPR